LANDFLIVVGYTW